MAIEHRHQHGILGQGRKQTLHGALAPPVPIAPAAMQPIGGSHRQQSSAWHILLYRLESAQRFRGDGAAVDKGQVGPLPWRSQPVPAFDNGPPHGRRHHPLRLLQWTRR